MKSFKEYVDWKKETGYVKSTSVPGSGGRGGWTEPTKGFRVLIDLVDKKGKKFTIMIPPQQYHPAKDKKKAEEYAKGFIKDEEAKGSTIKKVKYAKI